MANLYDLLFGCHHKNYSFPLTKRRGQRLSPAASATGTYVSCLDCGKEFAYDWQEMKVIEPTKERFEHLATARAESYAGE